MTQNPNERVLAVLAKIVASPHPIKDITPSGNEFYFRYNDRAFSIAKRSADPDFGRYSFYVYPQWPIESPLITLASRFDGPEGPELPMAAFHEGKLPEASDNLAALHSLLAARYLQLDDVFDDILGEPK